MENENLKALIQGKTLNAYQKGLAVKEFKFLLSSNGTQDQALSMSGVGGCLICPNCENPYPHTRTDGSHYCEECGNDWTD